MRQAPDVFPLVSPGTAPEPGRSAPILSVSPPGLGQPVRGSRPFPQLPLWRTPEEGAPHGWALAGQPPWRQRVLQQGRLPGEAEPLTYRRTWAVEAVGGEGWWAEPPCLSWARGS